MVVFYPHCEDLRKISSEENVPRKEGRKIVREENQEESKNIQNTLNSYSKSNYKKSTIEVIKGFQIEKEKHVR